MSGELVAWLTGCLDEDQQKAEKLLRVAQDTQLTFKDYKRFAGRDTPGWHDWPAVAAMCGRTLADIAAKRDILELHEPQGLGLVSTTDGCGEFRDVAPDSFEEIVSRSVACMACAGYPEAPCATLLALVQPLADRPGFREEWAVKG